MRQNALHNTKTVNNNDITIIIIIKRKFLSRKREFNYLKRELLSRIFLNTEAAAPICLKRRVNVRLSDCKKKILHAISTDETRGTRDRNKNDRRSFQFPTEPDWIREKSCPRYIEELGERSRGLIVWNSRRTDGCANNEKRINGERERERERERGTTGRETTRVASVRERKMRPVSDCASSSWISEHPRGKKAGGKAWKKRKKEKKTSRRSSV